MCDTKCRKDRNAPACEIATTVSSISRTISEQSSPAPLPPDAIFGQQRSGRTLTSVFQQNLPLPTYEEATTSRDYLSPPSSSISLDIPSTHSDEPPTGSSNGASPPPYYITLNLPPSYEEAIKKQNIFSLLYI